MSNMKMIQRINTGKQSFILERQIASLQWALEKSCSTTFYPNFPDKTGIVYRLSESVTTSFLYHKSYNTVGFDT